MPAGAVAFARDPGFACVVNLGPEPLAPPAGSQALLYSVPLTGDGRVPTDATAWFGVGAD